MKLIEKLLDYAKPWELPDVYLFTGNPVLKRDGAIVMGRGAAKQVRDTYPGIDVVLGRKILEQPEANIVWAPLFQDEVVPVEQWIGWFKVKEHWMEPARLDLIRASCRDLWDRATQRPEFTFHLNYPGVGNGKLDEQEVAPLLAKLPDNVWVYR